MRAITGNSCRTGSPSQKPIPLSTTTARFSTLRSHPATGVFDETLLHPHLPYARSARIALREHGLEEKLREEVSHPFDNTGEFDDIEAKEREINRD
ncbi:hypothetical protein [Microbulbifer sp.]|uniref:hypothetical protein n=1 Tax=Microbulbifer sp. TaxID=1908541 RepID=UPI003F353A4D